MNPLCHLEMSPLRQVCVKYTSLYTSVAVIRAPSKVQTQSHGPLLLHVHSATCIYELLNTTVLQQKQNKMLKVTSLHAVKACQLYLKCNFKATSEYKDRHQDLCTARPFYPREVKTVERTGNQMPGGASLNDKPASSGDLTEVTRLSGWSLVVLDARFIWLQGQLVTVLQGWRLVHRQPMPSGSHKVSPVSLTFLLFNGALWGLA